MDKNEKDPAIPPPPGYHDLPKEDMTLHLLPGEPIQSRKRYTANQMTAYGIHCADAALAQRAGSAKPSQPSGAVQSEAEYGLQVEMTDKGAHVRIYSMTGEVLVDQFHESPQAAVQSTQAVPTDIEVYAEMRKRNPQWNSYQAPRDVAVRLAIDCFRSLLPVQPDSELDAALADAARDVLVERRRQVEIEGYSHNDDDDRYDNGALAQAAACYAYPTLAYTFHKWPWAAHFWKPTDERRNLIKAGALILAEIERLDRAAMAAAPQTKEG